VVITSARPVTSVATSVSVNLLREGNKLTLALSPLGEQHGPDNSFDNRLVTWQARPSGEGTLLTVEIAATDSGSANESWQVIVEQLPVDEAVSVRTNKGKVIEVELDPHLFVEPEVYTGQHPLARRSQSL
jgi:hypothetical protein